MDTVYAVFDEPLLLTNIVRHLGTDDVVNLNRALEGSTRSEATLAWVLEEREKQAHADKVRRFRQVVACIVRTCSSHRTECGGDVLLRRRMRQLNRLFDFLVDNLWFRHEPDLQHMNDLIEINLIKLATADEEDFSLEALWYLERIYGLTVKTSYDPVKAAVIECVEDTDGNLHALN